MVILLLVLGQYGHLLWVPRYTILGYEPIVDFGNLVGYDAYGLGNHEFDRGVEGLIPFINETDFPVVAANLVSFTWYSIFEFLVTCCLNHAFFNSRTLHLHYVCIDGKI